MADSVDITSSNDFTEEKLKLHRSRPKEEVARGQCLYCKARILPEGDKPLRLYCDDDCKEDYEREELIKRKTSRMISGPGQY